MLAAIILAMPTAFLGTLVIAIIALADTIKIADRIYKGEPVDQWQFF